jgi:hypothetical protein
MNKLMEVWSLCRDVISLQVQQFGFPQGCFLLFKKKQHFELHLVQVLDIMNFTGQASDKGHLFTISQTAQCIFNKCLHFQ